MTQLRAFSYGGGVQSTAALVLAARGEINYPLFIFSNVGNDSENPATISYVEEVAKPYAAAHGIELVEVRRVLRNGGTRTLYQELTSETLASIPIPVYNTDGAPGRRSCTKHYKVVLIGRETKRRGATIHDPAIMGLGISIDEYHRMNTESGIPWQRNDYPLIDLRLSRVDCHRIIADAGLPNPGKSSCWFCPYKNKKDWQRMKIETPDLFMHAVVLEQDILAKGRRTGNDPHYLTRFGRPLHTLFGDQAAMDLDEDEDDMPCESGHCMT